MISFGTSGDVGLKLPLLQTLQFHSAFSGGKTYAFEFSHRRSWPDCPWYEGPDWLRVGADHTDEIAYVLGFPFTFSKNTSSRVPCFHAPLRD